ncbi:MULTISPECIES: aa3-type cytochrome c oxidase subunit IV [unclassified Rhizobium]|uniref:aa3-type cytochrome c oxidase subunit IV n=1 Tax=unclassified Rhizobium TaxID=2613769 RepID=UPI002B058614|nr:aa3-type cytochrome c oxidase subunit IV [Rhizobium sp. CC-YZS058]MEA3533557.1 aa3-type cytochrome c oxidase subunit IV [Rhizobium sp. CC-YZS058]
MAEHHTGPAETGAEMDYKEHEKTYSMFLEGAKFLTVFCVVLLIAMAALFFTNAGAFVSLILFVVLLVAGITLTR